MNRHRFKPAQVIAALEQTRGMVYLAAEWLGCDPDTIYNYVKRYASVRAALVKARGRTTDMAENKLFDAITDGDPWAIQFYLKTQGRDRGYVEKLDVSVLVQHTAERIAKEFAMTPQDVLEEARLLMLEEPHAS